MDFRKFQSTYTFICFVFQENEVIATQGAGGQYYDLNTFHAACRQLPVEVECWMYRQVNAPFNYNAAVYGPWPVGGCIVCLIPNIPGRHGELVRRNVVLAYVGTGNPAPAANRMNYRDPLNRGLNRFLGICCGVSEVLVLKVF